ncbi:hypothetical protein DEU56DRAFT_836444 [Suillus clintonianus]|uniref:uncharacterized protein n=1 Tax=Suillus clintonianus TaxID=1904413 RepID=UPI001B86B918|nr:uncharacterized protein DEU56DRAFT_836444 [Suillus clintonianus]KAG2119422.1 hypothetical protein DEU56DRAFT_836444 [Suillus clintonianus]
MNCVLEQPGSQLHGAPSITLRKSIARNGGQPFEDSDVLVLSSRSTSDPHSKDSTQLYLDLRLSKPLLPESTIMWGFAGFRVTLSSSPLRFRWNHYIDSHGQGGPPDEGTMTSCDGEEVETGIGVNPETGEEEQYEERWVDQPVTPTTLFAFLTSSREPSESDGFIAILGEHALAMRQFPNDTEFQAVRVRISTSSSSEVLFKQNADTLLPLLEFALSGADKLKGSPWQRGQEIILHEESWFVWDAGMTGGK